MNEGRIAALLRAASSPLAARIAFGVLTVAGLLIELQSVGRPVLVWQRLEIPPSKVRPEVGHCYLVDLGSATWADDASDPPALLLESGESLGPGYALHQDIRVNGYGRHSFWGRHLYFSASDNSDPRTNGRRYVARRPYPVSQGLAWLLLAAGIAAGTRAWLQWDSERRTSGRPLTPWTALADPLSWALMAAALAWTARLLGYVDMLQHPERHVGTTMMGVPYSDAAAWDNLGESVARGEGLAGGWSARRPLYAIILGGLYLWTGPSYTAAIHLNLLFGALTAAAVCRIGWVAVHPLVGVGAGVAFALSRARIDDSLSTMSETTGTLLGVLAVSALLTCLLRGQPSRGFVSGGLLALSNLTRTLSVLALPPLALATGVLLWRKTRSAKQSLGVAIVLLGGAGAAFAPWILRQQLVHGIPALSDNGVAALYAASSPRFGSWTPAVDHEAEAEGVPNDVRRRYEYFASGFSRNLRNHTRFYLQNAWASLRKDVAGLTVMSTDLRPTAVLLVLILGLQGLKSLGAANAHRRWSWLIAIALGGAAEWACPPTLRLAGDLVGLALALAAGRNMVWLLGIYLGASLAMTSATALGGEPRLLLMSQWVLTYGGLFLPFAGLGTLLAWLGGPGSRSPTMDGPRDLDWPTSWIAGHRAVRALARVCLVAVIGTLALLAYRTAAPGTRRPDAPVPISAAELEAALQSAQRLFPRVVHSDAGSQSEAFYRALRPGEAEEAMQGRLVVMRGRIGRHRYFIPRAFRRDYDARMLRTGSYARTYFHVWGSIAAGRPGPVDAVFPGRIPEDFLLSDVILVGRVDIDSSFPYEEVLLQVLTMTVCRGDAGAPDARTIVAHDPDHLTRLRKLRKAWAWSRAKESSRSDTAETAADAPS